MVGHARASVPKEILPGRSFTYLIRSATELIGSVGLTTSTNGDPRGHRQGHEVGGRLISSFLNSVTFTASVGLGAIMIVWPSGIVLLTAAAPTTPPAPGLFSTINGLPNRFSRCGAAKRARMSPAPPAANGTTMVTGLVG